MPPAVPIMGSALLMAVNSETFFFLLKRKKKKFENPTSQVYALGKNNTHHTLGSVEPMLSTMGTHSCLPAAVTGHTDKSTETGQVVSTQEGGEGWRREHTAQQRREAKVVKRGFLLRSAELRASAAPKSTGAPHC